jgi:hypothetical protein
MSKKVDLNTLEANLQTHDWTYEMSDDHGYWVSGSMHMKRIKVMVEKLYDIGLGKKVEELFYEYYPEDGCHVSSGYGIQITWTEYLDRMALEGKQVKKAVLQ